MKPSKQQKSTLATAEMLAERDRLKAECVRLSADLQVAEQHLAAAEATEQEIDARTGDVIVGHGHPLGAARVSRSAAKNSRDALKSGLSDAKRALANIEVTVSAPAEVEQAEAELAAVRAERSRINAELAAAESRLADLATKAGTLAASEASAEGAAVDAMGLGLPLDADALVLLAAERRVLTVALERLTAKVTQHHADLDALREREKEVRQTLRFNRTVVAGLERDAALRPILSILVKAAIMAGDDPRRIEVAVPQGVVDAVEAEMTEPGV
jgi:hypothetical protein